MGVSPPSCMLACCHAGCQAMPAGWWTCNDDSAAHVGAFVPLTNCLLRVGCALARVLAGAHPAHPAHH